MWKYKFISEHKAKKQEAQRKLMKPSGGIGKHGQDSPLEHFPIMNETNQLCDMCKIQFSNNSEMRNHIRNIHVDFIKKCFSKEALTNVIHNESYREWLEEITILDKDQLSIEKKKLALGL